MKARGREELFRSLRARGFDEDILSPVLDRLEREGWLDDLAAARSIVRAKCGRYGRRRLERELAAKGFSREAAAAALADLPAETEEATLRGAFVKLWRQTRGIPARERRGRVARALARRGFPPEAISAMIKGSHEVE
jgi:regulatory protein